MQGFIQLTFEQLPLVIGAHSDDANPELGSYPVWYRPRHGAHRVVRVLSVVRNVLMDLMVGHHPSHNTVHGGLTHATLERIRLEVEMHFQSTLATSHLFRGVHVAFRQPVQPFSLTTLWRYGLDRSERRRLGELVSDLVRATDECGLTDDEAQAIANHLNRAAANRTILQALSGPVGSTVVQGMCGHFTSTSEAHAARSRGENGVICDDCAGDNWRRPEDDDDHYYRESALYLHDDGSWYTYEEDDFDDDEDGGCDPEALHNYATDVVCALGGPAFASRPDGAFTIGAELEVQATSKEHRANLVYEISESVGDMVLCKRDGSLDDSRGVELVSKPLSHRATKELFADVLSLLPRGTTAWDAGCCGLHVHIDSRAFTALSLLKFLSFWNDRDNATFIKKVAGRHPDFDSQAATYAARDGNFATDLKPIAKLKGCAANVERYRIVNVTTLSRLEMDRLGVDVPRGYEPRRPNASTVEVRVFRASLRKDRLLAQLDMAVATVHFARAASVNGTKAGHFLEWLRFNTGQFPHLAAFVGVRPALKALGNQLRDESTRASAQAFTRAELDTLTAAVKAKHAPVSI